MFAITCLWAPFLYNFEGACHSTLALRLHLVHELYHQITLARTCDTRDEKGLVFSVLFLYRLY